MQAMLRRSRRRRTNWMVSKSVKPVNYLISVATQLTCGVSAKPKRVMSNPNLPKHRRTKEKSGIGRNFEALSKSMGIKPKVKWHNYGRRKLANAQFPEHYER